MKIVLLFTSLALSLGLVAASASAQAPQLSTPKDKLSYAIGMDIGQTLKKQSIDVDPTPLSAAIKDTLTGGTTQQTDAQMKETLTAFSTALRAKQPTSTDKASKDKLSYAIGMDIGQTLKKQSIDVDAAPLSAAIKDTLAGTPPKLSDDQMKEVLTTFSTQMKAKAQAANQAAAADNEKAGAEFLAANKAKPGVQTLPSGLQYVVTKDGTGPMPNATDTVSVNYRGTLIDGTEFDSSYKRGEPASFPVNGVIKGWTEALLKMKVGSKWQLFIPATLAYGSNPPPGAPIKPGSTLVFDVELLSIGK